MDDRQISQLSRLLAYVETHRDFQVYPAPAIMNECRSIVADRDYWRLRLLCEQVWTMGCDASQRLIVRVWKILGLKVSL